MTDFTSRPNPDVYQTTESFDIGMFSLEVWERTENGHRIWVLSSGENHTAIHGEFAAELLRDRTE